MPGGQPQILTGKIAGGLGLVHDPSSPYPYDHIAVVPDGLGGVDLGLLVAVLPRPEGEMVFHPRPLQGPEDPAIAGLPGSGPGNDEGLFPQPGDLSGQSLQGSLLLDVPAGAEFIGVVQFDLGKCSCFRYFC